MLRFITSLLLLVFLTHSLHAQQFRIKKLVRHSHYNQASMIEAYTFDYHYSGDKPGPVNWRWAEVISLGNVALQWNPNSTLLYDSATQAYKNPVTPPAFSYFFQTINSQNQVTQREIHERSTASAPLTLVVTQTYNYNGTELTSTAINNNSYQYKYKNGKLDTIYYYPPGMTQPTVTNVYSYNTGGLLSGTAVYSTTALNVTSYYYDAQNLLTDRITITTDYPASLTDTTYRAIFTYNSQDLVATEETWSSNLGADLQLKALHVSSYDANDNKLEMITSIDRNGIFDTLGKRIYSYNSNNMVSKLEFLNWDGAQFIQKSDTTEVTSSHILTLDYELYWPVGVEEVKDNINFKFYPSPASDFIRIETEWKQAQPFTAAILDMQGRTIRQWQEPAAKNYARTIPLTELPAGMYVIKLSCGNEQLTKQFAIYK